MAQKAFLKSLVWHPETMRWLPFLLALPLAAQTFHANPEKIIQGEVIKVTTEAGTTSARMNGKTIPLFTQPDGGRLGLMPVPVLTKPGIYTLELLDANGATTNKLPITVLDARYHRENIAIAPAIAGLKPSPGEQQTVGDFRNTVSDVRYWKEPFEPPLPGCVTSPFGSMRMHNGKPTGDFHAGLDQRGAAGTPIHPITPGVVKIVEKYNLRGGTVAVDHGQGVETIYLHMSAFQAKEGQHVTPNDVIGYVGSTGRSTGPHVHWSLYINGEPMNPRQWMSLQACSAAAHPPLKTPAKKTP
jgi:murein DD-endopeptidase MepM/ murein hydrolase activator NlpD